MKFKTQSVFLIFIVTSILSSCMSEPKDDYIINDVLFESDGYRPTDFNSITSDNLELIWSETFENNNRNWTLQNDYKTYKSEIKNGQYVLTNYSNDNAYSFTQPSEIDQSRDFQITASVKLIQNKSTGLMVKSGTEFILMMVNKTRQVYVTHYYDGSYHDVKLVDKFEEPQNSTSFNTFVIRKIYGKYYFYINGLYTGIEYENSSTIDRVGFFLNADAGMIIEDINVDYINF